MNNFFKNSRKASTPTGNSPTPNPRQGANSSNLERGTTSLAVLQFVALMRGEWRMQAPWSPFRVVSMKAEGRYCLGCYGVRAHDVLEGVDEWGNMVKLNICRHCGKQREE